MTFSNDSDFISFRHHVFVKTGHKDAQLAEVGPRFEMRCKLSFGRMKTLAIYMIPNGSLLHSIRNQAWNCRSYRRRFRMAPYTIHQNCPQEGSTLELFIYSLNLIISIYIRLHVIVLTHFNPLFFFSSLISAINTIKPSTRVLSK
jgi:hypothetical protein